MKRINLSSRLTNSQYAELIKRIRPFVSFDWNLNDVKKYGLSKYDKQTIKIYYKEIKALQSRPHQIYRPRKKENLRTSQEYSQHQKKLKYLKTAFVPTDGQKAKIYFSKKGKMKVILGSKVEQKFIPLDAKKLSKNAINHVNEKIKNYGNKTRFKVNAGEYEINKTMEKIFVAQYVQSLVDQYSTDKAKKEEHYFGRWLNGLKAITFKNQKNYQAYKKALKEERAKRKK